MQIEATLEALGLVLPAPVKTPAGVRLPFAFVRIHGNRAYISGHGPQNADGSLAQPLGKVGAEVSLEEGYNAARLTALSILASLKRAAWRPRPGNSMVESVRYGQLGLLVSHSNQQSSMASPTSFSNSMVPKWDNMRVLP